MAVPAWTASSAIEGYIEENPDRPGPAGALLIDHGVPVWALIGYSQATGRARVMSLGAILCLWTRCGPP
jgi:hypothetical protein